MATIPSKLKISNETYTASSDEGSWADSYQVLIEDVLLAVVTGSVTIAGPDGQALSYVTDWQTWEKDNEDPDDNEVVSLERFIYADQ